MNMTYQAKLLNITVVLLLLIINNNPLSAQTSERDTLKKVKPFKPYPPFRKFSVSYDILGSSDFSSKFKDRDFESGDIVNNSRIKISASFPVIRYKKFMLSVSGTYKGEIAKTSNVKNEFNYKHDENLSIDISALSFNGTWRDSLFNKPLIVNASLIMSSKDFKSVQNLNGIVGASLIMKYTRSTVITTGLIVIASKSVIPVFPTFSYWHKFSNSPLELDFLLPIRLSLRYSNFMNGWLTVGSELNSNVYYFKQSNDIFNGNYQHNQTEILSGISYEYPVSKVLIIGAKGGIRNTISSRMKEQNTAFNVDLIKFDTGATPFMVFTISALPWKLRKK